MKTAEKKLLDLLKKLLSDRALCFAWEYSKTLPWLLVSASQNRRIAVTYRGGFYNSTPLENVEGLGYLQPLDREKTTSNAAAAVNTYLKKGYDAAFKRMLDHRSTRPIKGRTFTLSQVRRLINARKSTKRHLAPLEFPPSLKDLLTPSPEEIARLKQSLKSSFDFPSE